MPVDPTISLGIQVPGAASGLGTVGDFAKIQNNLNEALLFRQTFQARQKAGQIISTTDPSDPEALTKALLGDKEVAPFAPQILNSIRQAESTLLDLQGKQLTQSQSVFQSVLKALPAALADPAQLPAIIKSQMATLPKGASVAPQTREALSSLVTSLTDGLPEGDPGKQAEVFKRRVLGWSAAGGVTPEVLKLYGGAPEMLNIGGSMQPVLGPTLTGEGARVLPGAIARTQEPGFQPPGTIPVGGARGSTGLALPNPQEPAAVMPAAPGEGTSPVAAGRAASEVLAGDGKPLAAGTSMKMPSYPEFTGGLSPAQIDTSKDLHKEFNDRELNSFRNANTTLGALQEMSNALDVMQKGGGLQVPGAWADFRNNFAKAAQTVEQMTGTKITGVGDIAKTAAYEDFTKAAGRTALTVLTEFLGNQREAASTIQNIAKAVPSPTNTYVGGKLVSTILQAQAQRTLDERNFKTAWISNNRGYLSPEVTTEFNRLHPIEGYIQNAYDKFGVEMGRAVKEGIIPYEDAKAGLRVVLQAKRAEADGKQQ